MSTYRLKPTSIINLAMLPILLIVAFINWIGLDIPTPPCVFKLLFEVECLGCGLTRAVMELSRFNWRHAIELNGAAPVVLLLIAYLFAREFSGEKKHG